MVKMFFRLGKNANRGNAMFERSQLEAFATVVEYRSFERAAISLNLTRSAVSQRIKALEETLSTVLLIRGRPVVPTSAGEIMLRHVKALRLLEHDVHHHLTSQVCGHDRTPLAIAVNADSLATWFGECSHALVEQLAVALEIVVEDQDHTKPMLLRGEVTGCIGTGTEAAQGFKATRLGEMEYRCVATPTFAQRFFPKGMHLRETVSAPAILFNRKDSLHDAFLKALFGVEVTRYVRHYFPSSVALLNAICSGNGYGVVPASQLRAMLDTGQLIDLSPELGLTVPLYWHHWLQEPPIAKQVTAFVVQFARRALAQPEPRQPQDAGTIKSGSCPCIPSIA